MDEAERTGKRKTKKVCLGKKGKKVGPVKVGRGFGREGGARNSLVTFQRRTIGENLCHPNSA